MWWNRWWQIDWFRSDLWFPERRQEVRGQVPSGQSRCKSLKVIPSSEFRSTTVRAERCWRRRRTTRRRSGVLVVVLLSTRPRRLRTIKPFVAFYGVVTYSFPPLLWHRLGTITRKSPHEPSLFDGFPWFPRFHRKEMEQDELRNRK